MQPNSQGKVVVLTAGFQAVEASPPKHVRQPFRTVFCARPLMQSTPAQGNPHVVTSLWPVGRILRKYIKGTFLVASVSHLSFNRHI